MIENTYFPNFGDVYFEHWSKFFLWGLFGCTVILAEEPQHTSVLIPNEGMSISWQIYINLPIWGTLRLKNSHQCCCTVSYIWISIYSFKMYVTELRQFCLKCVNKEKLISIMSFCQPLLISLSFISLISLSIYLYGTMTTRNCIKYAFSNLTTVNGSLFCDEIECQ